MSNAANTLPTVHHVRDEDGVVQKYIPLADYEALSGAAIELCERMSALPQVTSEPASDSVLDLVLGTKVREPA